MGRRKLRFVVRKNCERQRTNPRPSSLPVQLPLLAYLSAPVTDAGLLRSRLLKACVIPPNWLLADEDTSIFPDVTPSLVLYRPVQHNTLVAMGGLTCTLSVDETLKWTLRIGMDEINSVLLDEFPLSVDCVNLVLQLLEGVDKSAYCVGNADVKFSKLVTSHKGYFKDSHSKVVAKYDDRPLPAPTIRHCLCSLLISPVSPPDDPRCRKCSEYRRTLHAMAGHCSSTDDRTSISSHTNYRYLSTPEKHERMKLLHRENRAGRERVKRLKEKLSKAIEEQGVNLEADMMEDLQVIMEEEQQQALKGVEEGTFLHLFWQQQKEASLKNKRGMRWHPAMIKWCIFLRHQSRKAYETLRQSGCIHLPSQRTLQDYSHCVKSAAGFSLQIDQQLMQAANITTCEFYEKFVAILIDEMYVRQDLVYEKQSRKLVGFTSLGDINDHLVAFEKSIVEENPDEIDDVAKTMVVFMVRGLFSKLRYPYAQFPCSSLTGDLLYQPFWHAVFRLENMGLKVLATTFDGASVNRRLVRIHDLKAKSVFKVKNIHAQDGRDLFFFSDTPHLMKTTRNCWSSKARSLWNNGQDISWYHLVSLYETDAGRGTGLAMVPKLTYEHIHLTSFSKMRVDLAVQVLSESVSIALPLVLGPVAAETARFTSMFDRFFDCLNVSSFNAGARHCKSFLHPYRSASDERLEWIETKFLKYLDDWEKSVSARKGFTNAEKKRMLLSDETMLGLRMTANSFVHLVHYIFSLPEVKEKRLSFLSNTLCQDPLEGFFGCQRQRGRESDNPSVQEFYQNTSALKVVNSFCRNSTTGNCRGAKQEPPRSRVMTQQEVAPIPRRKRKRLNTD